MSITRNNLQLMTTKKPRTVSSIVRQNLLFSSFMITLSPIVFHSAAAAQISCLHNNYQNSVYGDTTDQFCDKFENSNYHADPVETDVFSTRHLMTDSLTTTTEGASIAYAVNVAKTPPSKLVLQKPINDSSDDYKIKLTTENLEILKTFYQGSSIDYDMYVASNDAEDVSARAPDDSIFIADSVDISPNVINAQTLMQFYLTADKNTSSVSEQATPVIRNDKSVLKVENEQLQRLQSDNQLNTQFSTHIDNGIQHSSTESFFIINRLKEIYNSFSFFGLKKK